MFSVEFGSDSKRFLKKSQKEIVVRILEAIEKLKNDPFPSGVKRVVGQKDKIFRIRVGDYRVQYCVFYETQTILISDINKRQRAYD